MKDDVDVIVFKILTYLYRKLKYFTIKHLLFVSVFLL